MTMESKASVEDTVIRSCVLAAEDSFVSTIGMLTGLSATGMKRSNILRALVVAVLVQATSLGIGNYLGEESTSNADSHPVVAGLTAFACFAGAGILTLLPFVGFERHQLLASVSVASVSLFVLGSYLAHRRKSKSYFASGLKFMVLGGAAMAIGTLIGAEEPV